MRPFIIDCDTGRDDALTLWICDALKLPLIAVMSSYGNVCLDQVVINNSNIIGSFKNLGNVQLFKGLNAPGREHSFYKSEVLKRQSSVGNGMSDVQIKQSGYKHGDYDVFKKWLFDYTNKNGLIDYIIIGPASNFAKLLKDPEVNVTDHIARIFMMGGKFDDLWDEMPGADFNVGADPYAVDMILKSGLPFYMVPMNVTWHVFDTLSDIMVLNPRSGNAVFAKDIMIAHLEKFAPEPIFRYHDPVLPFAVQQEAYYPHTASINLDEHSQDFGRIILDDKCGEQTVHIFEPTNTVRSQLGRDIRHALFDVTK